MLDNGPQDVRRYEPPANVHGILAAPPCTQFSFARTRGRKPRDFMKGLETVRACLEIIWKCQGRTEGVCPKKPYLRFWAIENPNGMLAWFLGKPAFVFNPYDFGDRYLKETALWGHFQEPVKCPVKLTAAEGIKFDKRLNPDLAELPADYPYPGDKRAARRSITPPGFAKAFFKTNQ